MAAAFICVLVGTAAVSKDSAPGVALSPTSAEMARKVTTGATGAESCKHARVGLRWYTQRRAEWYNKMGAGQPDSSPVRKELSGGSRPGNLAYKHPAQSCPQIRRAAEVARWLSWRARYEYERWFKRTYEKYRCIHEHEADWQDTGDPYWMGLQFDRTFMHSHGPQFVRRWGYGGWPVWAQLLTAEDAYKTRGFDPWPTYARYCA